MYYSDKTAINRKNFYNLDNKYFVCLRVKLSACKQYKSLLRKRAIAEILYISKLTTINQTFCGKSWLFRPQTTDQSSVKNR